VVRRPIRGMVFIRSVRLRRLTSRGVGDSIKRSGRNLHGPLFGRGKRNAQNVVPRCTFDGRHVTVGTVSIVGDRCEPYAVAALTRDVVAVNTGHGIN
jgi:hypothetical protein